MPHRTGGMRGATPFIKSWYAHDCWYPPSVLGVDLAKVICIDKEKMTVVLGTLEEGVRLESFGFWRPPIFKDNNLCKLLAYSNVPYLFNGTLVVYSYHPPSYTDVTLLPEHVLTIISERSRFGNEARLIETADKLGLPLEEMIKR